METNYFVHVSSVIDAGAVIGEGTRIWHFSHIMPSARIGKNCVIGQNAFIDSNVKIGSNVKIQNNVSVFNGVELEDEVFIGPSVVFTNVINPRSFVERKNEFKKTLVKKGATIGANATILCGITVGEFAMIGAGSVVVQDVLPHSIVVGNPALRKGWVSKSGYKLQFNDSGKAICKEENEVYMLINNVVSRL